MSELFRLYSKLTAGPCNKSYYCSLLYILVSTRAAIGQFWGPYSPVRPSKFETFFCGQNVFGRLSRNVYLKGLYADREKRRDTLQDEENLPNFHVERRKSSQLKEG